MADSYGSLTAAYKRKFRDLPIQTFTDWDSVPVVKQALNDHEFGYFRSSALLWDSMLRDDRIAAVLDTRLDDLLGLDREFHPPGDEEKGPGRDVADQLEKEFDLLFPRPAVYELARWGLGLGVGLGELRWKKRGGRTRGFELYVWHPTYVWWRWDTRSFWVSTMDGPEEVVPGKGKWVLYTPYGFQRGWIHGKVRSLAFLFLMRQWALRDWARNTEVHGLPIRKAIVPAAGKEEDKEKFQQQVAALGSETTIRLPRGESDGDKFDLELLEAENNTGEGFERYLKEIDSSIAIRVLGQNLTTEAGSGKGGGAYSAAQVHERVEGKILRADGAALGSCLKQQAVDLWVSLNHGDPELLAPSVGWKTDPDEDKTEASTALSNLTGALKNIKDTGAPIDVRQLLSDYDLPILKPGQTKPEDAGWLEAPEPPPPPAPPPGAPSPGPPGFAGPRGGTPVPKNGAPPKPPAALAYLVELARQARPGQVAGQVYADALADAAKGMGRAALLPDVVTIAAIVTDATDFVDLRHRLKAIFRHLHADQFAEVVKKAIILAELNGRLSAREDAERAR